MTFSADRGYNPATSTIARNYVENFDFMLANHIGLLFTGDVGTGKTFIASCIVNDLIDKGVSAMMIRLSRIINADLEGAAHILRIIEQSDLVVFDDVGAERDTSFAHERAFMAIDTRILARKPIIVTTNLTFEELAGVTDRMLKRIYDRIIGECVHVPIIGHSIRKVEQVQKTESARGLLLGDLKNTS
jgi:DNA replication protein DnaC